MNLKSDSGTSEEGPSAKTESVCLDFMRPFDLPGLTWTAPAIALAALMRRLGITELTLTEEELHPQGGMVLRAPNHVEIQ